MFSKLKENSLVDVRIYMTLILAGVAWSLYFLYPNYFISAAISIFIANFPCLFFAVGVYLDKGWILNVIGIENDHVISQSFVTPKCKGMYLGVSQAWLIGAVISLIDSVSVGTFLPSLKLFAIVLGIYFTSRVLTQVMGFYIYWIARISNDSELKTYAADDLIFKQSREATKFNYYYGVWLGVPLIMSLVAYFFAECFFPITFAVRVGFILCTVLFFKWMVLFFILVQIFDANVSLLNVLSQAEFGGCQHDITAKSLQYRLYFVKFMFCLFLFIEALIIIMLYKNTLP